MQDIDDCDLDALPSEVATAAIAGLFREVKWQTGSQYPGDDNTPIYEVSTVNPMRSRDAEWVYFSADMPSRDVGADFRCKLETRKEVLGEFSFTRLGVRWELLRLTSSTISTPDVLPFTIEGANAKEQDFCDRINAIYPRYTGERTGWTHFLAPWATIDARDIEVRVDQLKKYSESKP